ncbi:MAG: 3-isopropylmalate/(R)-2-methylmalate dehydratase small subunit [Puniceicoccaceae bacterium 5H]|nr:MAG: 3-isopropylmalate/(R)-2-methylmalate dehydratase small subunit [Puniceicoccaceae bacterium 5H]
MALPKINQIAGRAVYVPGDDIDTDRIIPARFMKCVTFDGLGEYVFYDVRKNEDGTDRKHPLNDPKFSGATILISGNNFGCGSSREHAPQAIYRAGFRAVIAESFAEIFFGNSTQLGMPCVSATHDDIQALVRALQADPDMTVMIDLEMQRIHFGDVSISCEIRETNRQALVGGYWDPIQDLINGEEQVEAVANDLAYFRATAD